MGEYVPEPYPGWRYGLGGEVRLVRNEEEELALGPCWYDSPRAAEMAAVIPDPPMNPVAAAILQTTPMANPPQPTMPLKRKRGRPRRAPAVVTPPVDTPKEG